MDDKLEKGKVFGKTTVTVSDTAANMITIMDFMPVHMTLMLALIMFYS